MIKKEAAVEKAKLFAYLRGSTWDDNNYVCVKVNLHQQPCWKVSHESGNETDMPWNERVSGTPVEYYVSMVTGEVIGIMIGRGDVMLLPQKEIPH
jgi:hypothetical protein